MTTVSIVRPIPHGVAFVYDPTMIIDVPSDTSAGPVLFTSNCLTLWTIGEDEGPVEITITDCAPDSLGAPVFEGALETPGKRIAFNDSGASELIGVDVESDPTSIEVFANDSLYPTKLTCVVRR